MIKFQNKNEGHRSYDVMQACVCLSVVRADPWKLRTTPKLVLGSGDGLARTGTIKAAYIRRVKAILFNLTDKNYGGCFYRLSV